MSLRFGLKWSFQNPGFARVPWEQLYRTHLDLIAESETLGYDHVWLTEHHFVDDGYSPSLHTIGAAVAARTNRIRIGTHLLLLPLHNPVRVAEDTATVDLMSAGRFDLGVGQGYRRGEFESQGISRAERGGRMEEGLTVVQRLLRGETVTFDGRFTTLRDVRISPPALQRPHPPIWVGAAMPKAVERAARMGCHFLNGGRPDSSERYDEALRVHGRDPKDYKIAAMRPVYVAPFREQAWEIAARPLHHMASCYLDWLTEGEDESGERDRTTVPSVEEIVQAQSFDFFGGEALVGTPRDVVDRLEDYVSRGRVTDIVCTLPMPGMTPEQIRLGMTLFARDVIPHFRHP